MNVSLISSAPAAEKAAGARPSLSHLRPGYDRGMGRYLILCAAVCLFVFDMETPTRWLGSIGWWIDAIVLVAVYGAAGWIGLGWVGRRLPPDAP